MRVEIFTDGSSSQKPFKFAGWAATLLIEGQKPIIYYGYLGEGSTNNQGELLGVMVGVWLYKAYKKPEGVELNTDSQYSIGVLRKGNNYFTNENIIELGKELLKEIPYSKLPIKWVKGHSGVFGNELADKFAGYGKKQTKIKSNDYVTRYFESKEEILDFLQRGL